MISTQSPYHISPIRLCTLLMMCSLLSFTTKSSAQPTPPPDTEPSTRTGVHVESTPTRIDALNLNIDLPKGSVTETTSFGTNATMGIGFPNQIGVMTIKEQRTSNPDLTIADVAKSMISQLTGRVGATTGQLIEREQNLEIKQWTGERFYIKHLGINGKPDTIRGMTIFQSQPRRFLIFDFTTLASNFDQARLYYETSIASMELGSTTKTDARRAAAIQSMLTFLDERSIEDYQNAMTGKKDRWERLYLPATTGDEMDATEYGYRKVRSWGGFKGELGDKPRESWNADDRKLGYFVRIDAMALEGDIRVDTRATFYMSQDSKEESWTIKMSLRQDGAQHTSTITGARSGTSMAIMLDQSGSTPEKTHPLIQGQGYISQVQSYLVGTLLAKNAQPGQYASYAYNSAEGAITLRWDTVEKPEETPDLTRITTKTSPNTPATASYYDKEGNLMRVRLSNERIWEPIELDRLIKLWKKKGLPLE